MGLFGEPIKFTDSDFLTQCPHHINTQCFKYCPAGTQAYGDASFDVSECVGCSVLGKHGWKDGNCH